MSQRPSRIRGSSLDSPCSSAPARCIHFANEAGGRRSYGALLQGDAGLAVARDPRDILERPPAHNDKMRQGFTATAPNRLRLTDITEHYETRGSCKPTAKRSAASSRTRSRRRPTRRPAHTSRFRATGADRPPSGQTASTSPIKFGTWAQGVLFVAANFHTAVVAD